MGAPLALLNRQQKGRLAETIVTAAFLAWGFEVLKPEVDDRGVDLIVSSDSETFYRVQVKGTTGDSPAFFTLRQLRSATNDGKTTDLLLIAYVRLDAEPSPEIFIIPFKAWDDARIPALVFRRYGKSGQTTEPEYGINYSQKNAPLLEPYRADTVLSELSGRKAG